MTATASTHRHTDSLSLSLIFRFHVGRHTPVLTRCDRVRERNWKCKEEACSRLRFCLIDTKDSNLIHLSLAHAQFYRHQILCLSGVCVCGVREWLARENESSKYNYDYVRWRSITHLKIFLEKHRRRRELAMQTKQRRIVSLSKFVHLCVRDIDCK